MNKIQNTSYQFVSFLRSCIILSCVYWNVNHHGANAFTLTKGLILQKYNHHHRHNEFQKRPSNFQFKSKERHENTMVGINSTDDHVDSLIQIVKVDCMEHLLALWKFRQWLKIDDDDDDTNNLFSQLEPRIQENFKTELNRKDIIRVIALQQQRKNEDDHIVVVGAADVLFRNFPDNGSSVCPRVPNDPPHGSIRNVHVDSTVRQCGIGTQLIQCILQQCHNNMIMESLLLEVDTDNIAAVQLYTKSGFQIIQEVWNGEGLIMKKSLKGSSQQ